MANIIDIIIRGNDQATATLKQTQTAVTGLDTSLVSLASKEAILYGVVGAITAIGSAAVMAAKQVGDQVEQLENLARSAGTTSENIQVLERAFQRQGLNADAARAALFNLNRAIADQNPILDALKINTDDAYEALLQLSIAYSQSSQEAEKAAITQILLGRGGRELQPIMSNLVSGVIQASESFKEFNGIFSEADKAVANAADNSFDQFNERLKDMKKNVDVLAARVVPGFMAAFTMGFFNDDPQPGVPMAIDRTGGEVDLAAALRTSELRKAAADAAERELKADREKFQLVTSQVLNPTASIGSRILAGGLPGQRGTGFEPGALPGVGDTVPVPMLDPGEFRAIASELVEIAEAASQGIGYAFEFVFVNLRNSLQTFRTAWAAIWDALATEALAAIGRIVASKLIGGLFGFLAGFGGPLGAIFATAGSTVATRALAPVPGGGGGIGGNTFIVQTFTPSETLAALVSPTGPLRRANDRLFELGAVGA